jgi:hypothetical protein
MAATAPLPQHLTALERANTIRFARAAVMRRVAAGELTVHDVLIPDDVPGVEPVPDCLAGATLADLLARQRRWGPIRVARFCAMLAIPEHKTLGALTIRQRRTIVAHLEDPAGARGHEERARAIAVGEAEARRLATDAARAAREREAAERRRIAELPPELRIECPTCTAKVGEDCATYDPVTDRWSEPQGGHAARRKAAGL